MADVPKESGDGSRASGTSDPDPANLPPRTLVQKDPVEVARGTPTGRWFAIFAGLTVLVTALAAVIAHFQNGTESRVTPMNVSPTAIASVGPTTINAPEHRDAVPSPAAPQPTLAADLPAGVVLAYFGEVGPNRPLPSGWLLCAGGTVSAGRYPRLADALGQKDGRIHIPDLQGMFLRGVEGGRQVGTKQEAQVGSHQHEVVLPFEQNANGTENNVAYLHFDVNGRTPRKVMTVLPDQPVETRPRNIGVNWIISTGSAD